MVVQEVFEQLLERPLRLVAEEEKDISWQSLIFAVPKGVMAWMARASTNCLASPDNLAKWKKIVDPKCPLCSTSPCTLGHLLSNCKEALDRFEWRHNNILHYLMSLFTSQQQEGVEIFADLDGHRVNGVTIPADVAMTASRSSAVFSASVSAAARNLIKLSNESSCWTSFLIKQLKNIASGYKEYQKSKCLFLCLQFRLIANWTTESSLVWKDQMLYLRQTTGFDRIVQCADFRTKHM